MCGAHANVHLRLSRAPHSPLYLSPSHPPSPLPPHSLFTRDLAVGTLRESEFKATRRTDVRDLYVFVYLRVCVCVCVCVYLCVCVSACVRASCIVGGDQGKDLSKR